jgi:hypothetical protein
LVKRLEDTPVLHWRHSSAAFEQPPEERRGYVPDPKADFIDIARSEDSRSLFASSIRRSAR